MKTWLMHIKRRTQQRRATQQSAQSNNRTTAEGAVFDYFTQARSWADDVFANLETARNRWRATVLYGFIPLCVLLLGCIVCLVPAQHVIPLMINHYQDGVVTVTPFHNGLAPKNAAEVKSDIARYIRVRATYSAATYNYSYRLMQLLSTPSVMTAYARTQSMHNPHSPIRVLGNHGYRTISIQSILFLDKATQHNQRKLGPVHHNLAQVNFVLTTHNTRTAQIIREPMTALVTWQYRRLPADPTDRWLDWNGFIVTAYHVVVRHLAAT